MFEHFTEEARQVVVLAQEEAREIGHDYIGTEHILLGLLRAAPSAAHEALTSFGVGLDDARDAIVRIVGPRDPPVRRAIPVTPRGKKVLELSLREALSLGHNHVRSEHILLGLLREGEGVAMRVLLDFGADGEALRQALLDRLSERPPRRQVPGLAASWTPSGRSPEDVWTDGVARHLGGLGGEIRAELDREPDAGDLLLALACTPGTLVERALRELDVDLDELWGRIEVARRERLAEQAAVEREIADVARAKDAAIEAQDFARAAELRDAERELRERPLGSRSVHAETLAEVRRRLGIPRG